MALDRIHTQLRSVAVLQSEVSECLAFRGSEFGPSLRMAWANRSPDAEL